MVRTHPQWLKLRELVQEGAIGELRAVTGAFTYRNIDPNNIRNKADIGGGGLLDIGCYPITTSRFVTGREPRRVVSLLDRDPVFKVDRLGSVLLDYDGIQASFVYSTQIPGYQRMQFLGTKGRLEVEIPFNAPSRPALPPVPGRRVQPVRGRHQADRDPGLRPVRRRRRRLRRGDPEARRAAGAAGEHAGQHAGDRRGLPLRPHRPVGDAVSEVPTVAEPTAITRESLKNGVLQRMIAAGDPTGGSAVLRGAGGIAPVDPGGGGRGRRRRLGVRLRLADLEPGLPFRRAAHRADPWLAPPLLPVDRARPRHARPAGAGAGPRPRRHLPRRGVPHRRRGGGGGAGPDLAARDGDRVLHPALGHGGDAGRPGAGDRLHHQPRPASAMPAG